MVCLARALATAVVLCASTTVVRAQLLDTYLPDQALDTDAVLSRPRPEYVTPGLQLGSIILRPQLQETVGYDSNVFGRSGSPGSARIETDATLQAATNWSRDSLGLFVNVDNVETPQASELSHTDIVASVAGSLDIGDDQLRGAYTHLSLNLLPTDIDGLGLQQAVPYVVDDVRASYTTHFGRFTVIPDVDIDTYRFSNAVVAGQPRSDAYLDRDVFAPGVTTRYELAPQRDLVFVVRGTEAQYLTAQASQPPRNYIDLQVLTGIDFAASGVFRIRALAGFEVRSYASSQISGASSPIVQASVIWTPTQLTTVTGTITHRIEDAIEDNIFNYTYTELRLVVDHELRRNLLLQAYADVQRADYAQNGGTQTLYGGGASAAWLLNRNLQLRASVGLSDSQAPPPNTYTRKVVALQLQWAL